MFLILSLEQTLFPGFHPCAQFRGRASDCHIVCTTAPSSSRRLWGRWLHPQMQAQPHCCLYAAQQRNTAIRSQRDHLGVTYMGHTDWGRLPDCRPQKVMTLRPPAHHDLHALAPSVLSNASQCLLTSVSLGWGQPMQHIQGSRREKTELLVLPMSVYGHRKPGRIFPTTMLYRCLEHKPPFSFCHKHPYFQTAEMGLCPCLCLSHMGMVCKRWGASASCYPAS